MMKKRIVSVSGYQSTWFPGLTRRSAASAHRWAAWITSAFRPVIGFSYINKDTVGKAMAPGHQDKDAHCIRRDDLTLLAPTTKLWATLAMKPSTWTPRSLHQIRGKEGITEQQQKNKLQRCHIYSKLKCRPAVKTTTDDTETSQSNQLSKDKMSTFPQSGQLDYLRLNNQVRQEFLKFNLSLPFNGRHIKWISFGRTLAGIPLWAHNSSTADCNTLNRTVPPWGFNGSMFSEEKYKLRVCNKHKLKWKH